MKFKNNEQLVKEMCKKEFTADEIKSPLMKPQVQKFMVDYKRYLEELKEYGDIPEHIEIKDDDVYWKWYTDPSDPLEWVSFNPDIRNKSEEYQDAFLWLAEGCWLVDNGSDNTCINDYGFLHDDTEIPEINFQKNSVEDNIKAIKRYGLIEDFGLNEADL